MKRIGLQEDTVSSNCKGKLVESRPCPGREIKSTCQGEREPHAASRLKQSVPTLCMYASDELTAA
jgi:hypothetical protein